MTSGRGESFILKMQHGDTFDRFQLQENIVLGQRVRNYTIESSTDGSVWEALLSGSAIGMKRIHLLPKPIAVTNSLQIRLRITGAIATPELKSFGVFRPCPSGAEAVSRELI